MYDFNKYIKTRIPSMIEKSIKINELFTEEFDTIIRKTSIIIDFFTLQFTKDARLIVPIGTKDAPAGLSRINDSYVVITHTDNRPLFYAHSEEFKGYIRDKFSTLEKTHSDEFKLAIVLKYGDIVSDTDSKNPTFFNI